MENKGTDRVRVYKGLQKIFFAIPLMFVGPIILNSAFKNEAHFLYYPIVILGCLICLYSMFLFFKGLKTMVSGLFND